jgi:membrane protein
MRRKIVNTFALLKDAARLLADNDPMRMAGATAFFTTFALPPMLIIIVRTFGLFIDRRILGRKILGNVGNVIGEDGSRQILSVIQAVLAYQFNPVAKVLIFVFLMFVASTLFIIVKNSINQIWNIRLTGSPGRHVLSVLVTRAKAIGIILFTGVLFMVVMAADVVLAYLVPYLERIVPQLDWYILGLLNHVVSLLVVTAWFYVLFRFLPDGKPRNTIAISGALLTGVLFTIGKYVLQWMLSGRIQNLYGNSGALVLILLFVFYSALMLYYGAAFTKALAGQVHKDINPLPHAAVYHLADDDISETETA